MQTLVQLVQALSPAELREIATALAPYTRNAGFASAPAFTPYGIATPGAAGLTEIQYAEVPPVALNARTVQRSMLTADAPLLTGGIFSMPTALTAALGESWALEGHLFIIGSGGSGLTSQGVVGGTSAFTHVQTALEVPSTPGTVASMIDGWQAPPAIGNASVALGSLVSWGVTFAVHLRFWGGLHNCTTAGTALCQFFNGTGNTMTVKAGSYQIATRIA